MSRVHIGMDTDKVERDITKAYIVKLTDRIAELEKDNDELELDALKRMRVVSELEKTMDGICIAVFDNRGKAVTEATVSLVRAAVARFELPLDFKQKEQEL
jgi:hypothetical protein